MADKNLLGLFVKYPEPGKVKTRIARDAGRIQAAAAYRCIADKVFRNTVPEKGGFERIIFYTPEQRRQDFKAWIPGERMILQRGRGIGARMGNALRDLFRLGASKAVIAGVDIPDLTERVIQDAFRKLGAADMVMGPAEDGGYYLIGMKSFYGEIFRNISWSTDKVCRQTLSAADALNLRYDTVITLSDIDTIEDLRRYEELK